MTDILYEYTVESDQDVTGSVFMQRFNHFGDLSKQKICESQLPEVGCLTFSSLKGQVQLRMFTIIFNILRNSVYSR